MKKIKRTGLIMRLRKDSIKKRLRYSFSFLIIVPIVTITLLTHMIFSNAMRNNLLSYSSQLMYQLSLNMESEVNWLIDCTLELAYSDNLQGMVQFQKKADWDFLNNYRLAGNMSRTRFGGKKYVRSVDYIPLSGTIYNLYGKSDSTMQEAILQVLKETDEKTNPYFWYFPEKKEEPQIFFVCRVTKLSEGMVEGNLLVTMSEEFLSDFYSDMGNSLGEGTIILTVNESGTLISGDEEAYSSLEEGSLESVLKSDAGNESFPMQNGEYMGIWSGIGTTGWRTLAFIPYSYINSVSNSTSLMILVIGAVLLLVALVIAAVLHSSIVSPLNNILQYTGLLRQGNFNQRIEDSGEDEIRELADSFNRTTEKINSLMLDIKEQSEEKARLEFNALQAQINPHFLANTLNTISYLAQLRGMENIQNIAEALTHILMVNMGKEDEIITIEKELSYVKDYLLIQSYRYTNIQRVEFQLPEELMQYRIPKFVLQPIVENAVIHGISQMPAGKGTVRVSGYLYEGEIHLSVVDNGPGIPQEIQEKLLDKESHEIRGLGVRSVDRRLKLMFGESFGIFISSEPGFTKVELIFPAEGS